MTRTWWQRAVRDGVYVTDVNFDDSAGIYSVDICLRIDEEDGDTLGRAESRDEHSGSLQCDR